MSAAKGKLIPWTAGALALALPLAGCGDGGEPAPQTTASAPVAAVSASAPAPTDSATPQPTPTPSVTPVAVASPSPAPSASPGARPALCSEVPTRGRDYPNKPIVIPAKVADIATAGQTRLGVEALNGKPVCLDLDGIAHTSALALTSDRRFVSFSWFGYEEDGYKVIDRAGSGKVIETGGRPMFSSSRNRFAAAQVHSAGAGGLVNIRVWEVGKHGTQRIVNVSNEVQRDSDWRVERWGGENCVLLSMLPPDVDQGPRRRVQLRILKKSWALEALPTGTKACSGA